MSRTARDDAGAPTAAAPAWSTPSLREPRYSQSLERGLAILRCFSAARPVLGIAQIAGELGMSRPTTHRYVSTLEALGYLEQGAGRKYRLGLRVTDLGLAALNATGLRDHAHDELLDLARTTSYTAAVAVLDGADALFVDIVAGAHAAHPAAGLELQPGSRLPAYCTAPGKLLLAHLGDDERDTVAALALARRAPNTITSRRRLREELRGIRDAALAISDRELEPELCAIAAPVRDQNGAVRAAASLAAPVTAISAAVLADALGPHLVAAADRISARLGWRRADQRA